MTEYEHAGEWDCDVCGKSFPVETKIDALTHALSCTGDSTSPMNRPDGYTERKERITTQNKNDQSMNQDTQEKDGTERCENCDMPECVGGPNDKTHICKDPEDEPLTICESCLDSGWVGAVEVLD